MNKLALNKNLSPSQSHMTGSPINVCMHVLGQASTDVRVMREATALAEAGYVVTVVDLAEDSDHQREEQLRGVLLKHVLASRAFFATRFEHHILLRLLRISVSSTLRLLRTSADIYHAHDVSALPACYLVACLRRKPLVFDAHEMPLFERPLSSMGRGRRVIQRILSILLASIIPRCAAVITVSPLLITEISKRYHVQKAVLLRNVLEYQTVQKSDHLRQHLGLQPDVRIALYTGNLQASRGLEGLVRAASFLHKKNVIVMMGKDSDNTLAELQELIVSLGVTEQVRILPPVPYAELLAWTSSADIGLYVAPPDYSLNVRVTLPNKLFEYFMAGLPVLNSSIEPMAEIIQTCDAGQVLASLEPASLGTALNTMLADLNTLERQSRNALAAARETFYWEKERWQLIHLYEDLQHKEMRGSIGAAASDHS